MSDDNKKEQETSAWGSADVSSVGLIPGRYTLGPLFLMTVCPVFTIFLWYVYVEHEGSLSDFWVEAQDKGLLETMIRGWAISIPGAHEWKMIGVFSVMQLALMCFPAPDFKGPVTATGFVPVYKANGFPAYLITMATVVFCHLTGIFNLASLFDDLGRYLVALNMIAPVLCLFLWVKGHLAPTSSDNCLNGNPIREYFAGIELYPRISGFDVKMFTNCRFGMMLWPVLVVAYVFKQQEVNGGVISNSMIISATVQLVYLTKFFWWETGYLRSIDIMHDHAGFYLCWGCMIWVPIVYTSPGLYLVLQPVQWSTPAFAALLVAGVTAVYLNYDCDRQRQEFRAANGIINIWGSKATYIVAEYETVSGETRKSLLLTSGWWGVSRHLHYAFEIASAFFWTVPGGFGSLLQFFYVIFLTILLIDRAFRDDERCKAKYGKYWTEYCEKVPYRILPGIL